LALYGLLLIGIFYSAYRVMIAWWGNEDFNYCYLIAPIVLYLIWEKKERLAAVPSQSSWIGILPFALGLSFFWLGELGGEFYSLYLASWLIFFGLCWMHLGWKKLKIIWFPIVFLLTMFPPPNAINFPLTLKLKLLSSKIGVAIIQAYGLSAYREGNVIDLGFTQLQVVDACSGLRFLYPLIIMALLLAFFYKSSFWKKALLVISSIPITIITNSFRIAMTGILYNHWGSAVAEGFFHGFSGWFIFMFALSIMLLEMWVLTGFKGLFGKKNELTTPVESSPSQSMSAAQSSTGQAETQKEDPESAVKKGWRSFFHPPQFLVAVILLGLTLVLAQGVEFREKIPMSRSFAEFPLQVGEWTGKRDVMELKFIETLDFKDYVIVDYKDSDGKVVNFYTAYYDSQRKGESIHSPETCLPGGGWEFKKAGRTTVQLNPPEMTINRAFIQQGAAKQQLLGRPDPPADGWCVGAGYHAGV
jgi:exosortase D (VPLPA-CTERM-specific)